MERLTRARVGLDLGAPVMEQLVLLRLLEDAGADPRRATATGCASSATRWWPRSPSTLPEWRFRVPGGGLSLWCELPGPARLGTALAAEAERHGVIVAPGPVFAAEGGLDRFVRIPWTRRGRRARARRSPASRRPGTSSCRAAAPAPGRAAAPAG